jgi:hypothetical protein
MPRFPCENSYFHADGLVLFTSVDTDLRGNMIGGLFGVYGTYSYSIQVPGSSIFVI